MSGLPAQLEWRRFVCVLRKLGYVQQKSGPGLERVFVNPTHGPDSVSLKEHPILRRSHLRAYIRKLSLSVEEFLRLLKEC
jgi:hypothetical protein